MKPEERGIAMYISEDYLDKLIAEDVPYFDLTTYVLGIEACAGTIEFFTREDAIVCGTEEAERILKKLDVEVFERIPSGRKAAAGTVLLAGRGPAGSLHTGWKVCQNILDRYTGIATKTNALVERAKAVNKDIAVVATRKIFPGTKALTVKAIVAGGAMPHRLGLSETVLVFKQHMNFMGGFDGFLEKLPEIRHKICEKKLTVEAENMEQAMKLAKAGVDEIQFDKVPAAEIRKGLSSLRAEKPDLLILAAGGINESNIEEYAASGADAIVTTSLFDSKPTDIGVRIFA